MTRTTDSDTTLATVPSHRYGSERTRAPRRTARAKRRGISPLLVFLIIVAGLLVLLYPTAADWFSARNYNDQIVGYTQSVEDLPHEERLEKLRLADDYNSRMPRGPLRDPFAQATEADTLEEDAAYASYQDLLRVSDNGIIGSISYPGVGVFLPIYHGTSDEVISKGAGHLYGSSLPVGGPSTHSVLTAHSGLAHSRLFTPILDAELGDSFSVEVLGEKHFYEVTSITTVEPSDTEALQVREGEDYVTLLTCTPIGINSHRILVTGIRVPGPEEGGRQELEQAAVTAGFPWWLVGLGAGAAVSGIFIFRTRHRARNGARKTTHDTSAETARDTNVEAQE